MITIIYESEEWSNQQLAEEIRNHGLEVRMVHGCDKDQLLSIPESDIIINRIFPSASLRGNEEALKNTRELIRQNEDGTWINSAISFGFDCSKLKTYNTLRGAVEGIKIPAYLPQRDWRLHLNRLQTAKNGFCRKKDCGGRSQEFERFSSITEFEDKIEEFNLQPGGYLLQEFIPPEKGYTTRVELLGDKVITSLKRYVGADGISSYSRGSTYELYPDLPEEIAELCRQSASLLKMEMVSFDFIEDNNGICWLIDVNGTSNFTPDYIELLGFNPITAMGEYIVNRLVHLNKLSLQATL